MSDWRDKPVTVGEVYDALLEAADKAQTATRKVEETYKGGRRIVYQLIRYAGGIQVDLFKETAKALKERADG